MSTALQRADAPRVAFYNDPRVRAVFYQLLVRGFVLLGGWILVSNTMANLARLGVASGFGFLEPAVRVRHRPGADRLQLRQHLRPRLPRRLPQHHPGGGRRHHPGDDHRLHDGHRPAVAQLARSRPWPRSMSRPSATSRCCCSSCWSTPSSSTRCRSRAKAASCSSRCCSTPAACSCPSRCRRPGSASSRSSRSWRSWPSRSCCAGRRASAS